VHRPTWDFFYESYIGGPTYLNNQLFKYYKEGSAEFSQRQERAYRENYCKNVVDIVNSYIFKESALRKYNSPELEKFFENIDGKGNDIAHFMKRVSTLSSVVGRMYVVVDKGRLPEEEITGTYYDNLKTSPYCYIVYPQDVTDIAFDEFGRVKWAIIRERTRDDDDPFVSEGDYTSNYKLWQKGKWTLYDEGGTELDSGSTGMDFVPVVPVDSGEELGELSSTGIIYDIAYLDRSIFNNYSRIDAIIADQTFSQLIFPLEGLPLQEMMTDNDLRERFMKLATNRVLFYSVAAGESKPSYISPDATQAEFILSHIKHQITQLYTSLGLQPIQSSNYASGTSKEWDFDRLNKILAGKANNLEIAEKKIVEAFSRWQNKDTKTVINYPNEFDIRSLADELLLVQEFTLLDVSKTFNSEIKKNLATKALPKADKRTMDIIHSEIEERAEDLDLEKESFDFDEKARVEEEQNKSNQLLQKNYQTKAAISD
jgi:hypothetical protein